MRIVLSMLLLLAFSAQAEWFCRVSNGSQGPIKFHRDGDHRIWIPATEERTVRIPVDGELMNITDLDGATVLYEFTCNPPDTNYLFTLHVQVSTNEITGGYLAEQWETSVIRETSRESIVFQNIEYGFWSAFTILMGAMILKLMFKTTKPTSADVGA